MQLRYETGLTSEEYVKQKAWLNASLETCPLHPEGGCHLARHTAYQRVEPPGTLIARWYCPEGHTTFSLLPDCLASRLSSTLAEVEQVAATVESSTDSFEATAERLRPDVGRQGAVRWVRLRVTGALVALLAVKGLRPDVLAGAEPTVTSVRNLLARDGVLPALRELAGGQVTAVPHPVGLGHRSSGAGRGEEALQHEAGPDPPRGKG